MLAAPLYASGRDIQTVGARRTNIRGWLVGVFDMRAVLGSALAGTHGVRLSVRRLQAPTLSLPHSNPSRLGVTAAIGPAIHGADVLTRQFSFAADGRWVVTVSAIPSTGPISPTAQGILVAVIGILLSLFAFVLTRVLVRGRARALLMVDGKTRQLQHLALHDPLTGLPNRSLFHDRLSHALARAEREGSRAAAMLLDLDNFKLINDNLGHDVGDELPEGSHQLASSARTARATQSPALAVTSLRS